MLHIDDWASGVAYIDEVDVDGLDGATHTLMMTHDTFVVSELDSR